LLEILAVVPFHRINNGKIPTTKGKREEREKEGIMAKINKEAMLPKMIQPEIRTHQGIRPPARLL
jgi:hypothetical protein